MEGDLTIHNRSQLQAVIHSGDMSYDLFSNFGLNGLDYLRRIQRFSTVVPYMVGFPPLAIIFLLKKKDNYFLYHLFSLQTINGNHEEYRDFEYYKQIFPNIFQKNKKNLYYSYNIGNSHIIAFDSEIHYTKNDPQYFAD